MSRRWPKIIDDDKFTITADFDGKVVRAWHYDNDEERRRYMMYAREYVEGWGDGRQSAVTISTDSVFYQRFERARDDLSRLLDMLGDKNA